MKDHRTTRRRVRSNSLLIRHEGNASEEEQWTEESENRALVANGFESTSEGDDLWSKDGVLFGRNAALQNAGQTPLTSR